MGDFSEGFNKSVGIYYEKTEPEKQYGGPQSGLPPIFKVGQSLAPYLNIGLDFGSYSWRVSTFSKDSVYRLDPYEYSALVSEVLPLALESKIVLSLKVLLATGAKVRCNSSVYSPIDLSAELLRRMKNKIESSTQKLIAKAVISVPASLVHSQRTAIIESSEIAGINVLGLISDHSAAALNFCYSNKVRNGIFLVVSCGIYGFEAAVVDVQNGILETKAIKANMHLSGYAANLAMIKYVKGKHANADERALHIFVDRAKKSFSRGGSEWTESDEKLGLSLRKDEFDKCFHSMKLDYQTMLAELILESSVAISDLAGIILTGAGTKFWILRDAINRFRPDIPIFDGHVSSGAAIQAALLVNQLKDWVVWDALASPVYVAQGDQLRCVINANSPTPLNGSITLETREDGKAEAKIFQRAIDTGIDHEFLCVAKVASQIQIPVSQANTDVGLQQDVTLTVMAKVDGTLQFSARHKSLDTNVPLAVQDMIGGESEPIELQAI